MQNPTNRLQEDREPVGNLEFTSFEQSPLVEPLHQSYIKYAHFSITWFLQGLSRPSLKFKSFFSKSLHFTLTWSFQFFEKPPLSHLNCLHSLCKVPLFNLHVFNRLFTAPHSTRATSRFSIYMVFTCFLQVPILSFTLS